MRHPVYMQGKVLLSIIRNQGEHPPPPTHGGDLQRVNQRDHHHLGGQPNAIAYSPNALVSEKTKHIYMK
jgi:hypothetical protein